MNQPCVRLAVLGDPIRHSLSPMIHTYWLQQANLTGGYLPIHCPEDKLDLTLQQLANMGFAGCNLTLPLKQRLVQDKHSLPITNVSDLVHTVGAANTVCFKNDGWSLYNTDVDGLATALQTLGLDTLARRRVLILGAGGAARAAVTLAAREGAHITLANRTTSRARAVADALAPAATITDIRLDAQLLNDHEVILQTTSAWTGGTGFSLPEDISLDGKYVMDMMYQVGGTPFSRWAASKGARAKDGLTMLVAQAARSFALWTNIQVDLNTTMAWLHQQFANDQE